MRTRISIAAFAVAALGLAACQQGYQFDLPQTSNDFAQSVTYNNRVDVVLVLDNSSGMKIYSDKLQLALPTLINSFLAQKLDMHIAIVTTTMAGTQGVMGGQFVGSPKYLSSSTPNLAAQINARIASVGTTGSDLERGLDSVVTALSPAYLAGAGAGFLREDALLAIVALSSEDDKSANLGSSATPYKNFLDQLKGTYDDGTRRWTLNFIGVLSLSGSCQTSDISDYKEPGARWMSLASISNGVQGSICDTDYSVAASNIRIRISQILTDFPLDKIPDIATIHVFVGGVEVPKGDVNGWSYISATNVIRFNGTAVPAADAGIRVDFKPAGAN